MKKVSKYENKFAKLQKKAAEFNFRNQLKTVKKKEFTMDEEEAAAVSHKFNILKYGQKLFYFILLDTLEFYIHKLVELDDINVKEMSFFRLLNKPTLNV